MRLRELINLLGSNVREASYFIRYPFQTIYQRLQPRGQRIYENVELPIGQKTLGQEKSAQRAEARLRSDTTPASPQEEGRVVSQATSQIVAAKIPQIIRSRSRQVVSLPILPKDKEIRGRRGRYRIESLLKTGERARLYTGVQVLSNKSVLIKEYLLPERDFNLKEAKERKDKFEIQSSVNLKNGLGQDFRLVNSWDAIAPPKEKCCYLVTELIENSLTLREYLAEAGPMSAYQVRQVLNQVLQTLCFLHSQRIRLSTGEVQLGLSHGNLSLDSLLIAINDQRSAIDEQQFFIYVSDLAFWEHLFVPPTTQTTKPSVTQDLKDLGTVGLYLLAGTTVDSVSGQTLDPKIKQQWPTVNDLPLKEFIQRLLGLNGFFRSAEDARQELLRLPSESEINSAASAKLEEEEVKRSRFRLILRFLCLGVLGGFIGALIWLLLVNLMRNRQVPMIGDLVNGRSPCCIKDVDITDIPPEQKIKYTAAGTEEEWKYLMMQPKLVSSSRNFEDELKARQMKLQLVYVSTSSESSARQLVLSNEINFFITDLVGDSDDSISKEKLAVEPIAYNGIAVFLAFSDAQRKGSLTEALHGKISFEQLRKLYTGKITNWRELGKTMPNLQVDLYVPSEFEAVNIFKSIVFKDHPDELKQFEQMLAQKKIIRKSTLDALRDNFLVNLESKKKGSIGFGFINEVFDQCSVYPLAVGEEGHEVQPLALDNSQPMESNKPLEPNVNLCNKKGSYRPDVEAFKSGAYLLGYRLAVVYPKDDQRSLPGKKFAEMLTTDEGQSLLSEAGLVPVRSLTK